MSRTKEIGTAVGTLACALSIGFAMQSTETANQRYGAVQASPKPVPTPADVEVDEDVPASKMMDVQQITLTSALPGDTDSATSKPKAPKIAAERVAAAASTPLIVTPVEKIETPVQECSINAEATPRDAAFVRLNLAANCRANEIVTIHHNGMMFSDQVGSDGTLALSIPALAESAVFIFAFGDGAGAVAHADVTDLNMYKRVVLQWSGTSGFELHAREFGADYGTEGHIWNGVETPLARMTSGGGGILTALGDRTKVEPLVAEVYSFPADFSGRNGQIDLSIEAPITNANCGLEIEAQTLELNDGTGLRTQNLTLAVPGCDAIGDYLVLNNILDTLKVAAK